MNNKKTIFEKIHQANKEYLNHPAEEILLRLESVLLEYLKQYDKDTDIWLKLIMVEFTPPLGDYDRIENYVNNVLQYDPHNINALLILSYAQSIYRGKIKKELLESLMQIKSNDQELLAMIDLAKAWYYEQIDEKKYEEFLLSSVNYCQNHVYNLLNLGELYLKKGQKKHGILLIDKAINNINKYYKNNLEIYDITSVDNFFDEYFKGTKMTSENKNYIINMCKKLSS